MGKYDGRADQINPDGQGFRLRVKLVRDPEPGVECDTTAVGPQAVGRFEVPTTPEFKLSENRY